MSTYPQRVADNVLPLSIAKALPEAFKEWYFTDNIQDHETAEEVCELCDQEHVRYHFEIKNRFTNAVLQVGSSCILKFQVQVFENGKLLDKKESTQKLSKLKKKMRFESCIRALNEIAVRENNPILTNALNFYNLKGYLTPKLAFVVFWRLKENEVDYHPSFFKISLKRQKYKDDLMRMKTERVHTIWPALSASQRKIAIVCGHCAPSKR